MNFGSVSPEQEQTILDECLQDRELVDLIVAGEKDKPRKLEDGTFDHVSPNLRVAQERFHEFFLQIVGEYYDVMDKGRVWMRLRKTVGESNRD